MDKRNRQPECGLQPIRGNHAYCGKPGYAVHPLEHATDRTENDFNHTCTEPIDSCAVSFCSDEVNADESLR